MRTRVNNAREARVTAKAARNLEQGVGDQAFQLNLQLRHAHVHMNQLIEMQFVTKTF